MSGKFYDRRWWTLGREVWKRSLKHMSGGNRAEKAARTPVPHSGGPCDLTMPPLYRLITRETPDVVNRGPLIKQCRRRGNPAGDEPIKAMRGYPQSGLACQRFDDGVPDEHSTDYCLRRFCSGANRGIPRG